MSSKACIIGAGASGLAAALPSREEMERTIDEDQTALTDRYVSSTRHTIQVDFFPYRRWVEQQLGTRVST